MRVFCRSGLAARFFAASICAVSVLTGTDGFAVAVQDGATFVSNAHSRSTTWLLLRHAERDGELDALAETGKARTLVLRQLGEILNVTAVYSTDFSRTKGTVQPLAESRGLEVQVYDQATDEWLDEIRQANGGGVAVIVGHSNTVGVIAGKLAGAEPFVIGHDEYDSLFVITTNGEHSSAVRLKYGRSSAGAESAGADRMGPVKSPEIP